MESAFGKVLFFHSIIRWVFFLAFLFSFMKISLAFFKKREIGSSERLPHLISLILMDIQVMIGLGLYFFLSPTTKLAFDNFKDAMKQKEIRFFAVEHTTLMIGALIFFHIANIIFKRGESSTKTKKVFIYYVLTFLFLLLGMPWFRPLFPN